MEILKGVTSMMKLTNFRNSNRDSMALMGTLLRRADVWKFSTWHLHACEQKRTHDFVKEKQRETNERKRAREREVCVCV